MPLAKLRIEYEEAAYQEIAGEGACVGFAAGTYFTVANAERPGRRQGIRAHARSSTPRRTGAR